MRPRVSFFAAFVRLAMFFAPVAGAVDAGAVTVDGTVRRPAAAVTKTVEVDRYKTNRGTRAEGDESRPSSVPCACNPGEFAVVWITGERLPAPVIPARPPTMTQRDRMFVPAVLAVPVGATVEFPNDDPFFHNVFSYSKIRSFDLGRYPKGESHGVRFDKPGIVPIFCEIHYSMRAYIHVFATPWFTVSDIQGRFSIDGVAPGSYTIHVWQENLPEIVRDITVGDAGLTVDLQ
jgi:hypothetical protein